MEKYVLKLNAASIAFTVLLNGFPVFEYTDLNNIGFEYPLNAYVKSGENELEVTLQKNPMDALVRMNIEVVSKESNLITPLAQFKAPEFSIEKPENSFVTKLKFKASPSFKTPSYLTGVKLTELPNIGIALVKVMEQLHGIYKAGNVAEIISLSEEKIKEIAIATGIKPLDFTEKYRNSLARVMKGGVAVLQPFVAKNCKILFYCEGKLATVVAKETNEPIITFDIENGAMQQSYPVYFYSPDGKELLIIR